MIEKLTIGIVGNQYSNGGNQPLINIDSPFYLYSEYPFDTNVMSGYYVEVKHMGEYISYVLNLRPSLVHSVGATRDGVFWIALTIPTGMNVYDKDGCCISPLNILGKVFSIFSENYMQKRGNGYEFKEGTCFRQPVDDYIDSLKLVRNPFIYPIRMDSNGGVCYLSMDREKMGLFLKDTQYPEFAQYKSVIIAESVLSQTPFISSVPRPLYVDVKHGVRLLGQIDYYGKQNFECVVEPSNTDTHDNVSVRFSLDDLKNSSEEYRGNNFTARRQSSYISVEPVFPEKKRFIKINSDDSMWKGSYIENGPDRIYAQLSESAYGFFLSVDQFSGEWTLHLAPSSEFCDVVWQFAIEGDIATPKCPRLVSDGIIAIDGKIKEKIIAAYESTIAPIRNTASSNAPKTPEIPDNEADVILDGDNVKFIKDDPHARLILSYGSKIIYEVEAEKLSGIWRLEDPYNPHLCGYELEVNSKKHTYTVKKATEGLPKHIISVDDCVTSENDRSENIGLLNHVLGEMKKLPMLKILIPISVVLVIGVLLGLLFYNEPQVSDSDKSSSLKEKVETFKEWFKKSTNPKENIDPTRRGETVDSSEQKINISYIRECVNNLNNQDLSFADLKSLLEKRVSETDEQEEINAQKEVDYLWGIYNEIMELQKEDSYYLKKTWAEYNRPGGYQSGNVLRKNAVGLNSINRGIYSILNNKLKPLYLSDDDKSTSYNTFQKKYLPHCENKDDNSIQKFRQIATFYQIDTLYTAYRCSLSGSN